MKRPEKSRPKGLPASPSALVAALLPATERSDEDVRNQDQRDRTRLLEDFEDALAKNPSLNAEERDTAMRRYADALSQAPVTLGVPALEEIKESFRLAIDGMIESNELNPGEKEGLIDQMKEALQAVDSEEIRLSYEYAHRLEQDGPEKAAQWMAERKASKGFDVDNTVEPVSGLAGALRPTASTRRRRR